IVRSPSTVVAFPPASSTIIPSGDKSHGFDTQSTAHSTAPSATSMCCQKPPIDRLFFAASANLRIRSRASRFLLGPVPVVKTIASKSRVIRKPGSRRSFRQAPSPRYANHRVPFPNAGALTIPATISPFSSMPISVPNVGMPRVNSSVPSIGSIIIRARAFVAGPLGASLLVSRSEEHTSELQSLTNLVCRLLLEKKKQHRHTHYTATHR